MKKGRVPYCFLAAILGLQFLSVPSVSAQSRSAVSTLVVYKTPT